MHYATMHGLAQAMQPELTNDLVLRHRAKAFIAAWLMDRALDRLEQRQAMPTRRKAVLPETVLPPTAVAGAVPEANGTPSPRPSPRQRSLHRGRAGGESTASVPPGALVTLERWRRTLWRGPRHCIALVAD